MSCTVGFETRLTPKQAEQRAKSHWDMWRLVLDAGMDYQAVFCCMTPTEIAEANVAYDLLLEARRKAMEAVKEG